MEYIKHTLYYIQIVLSVLLVVSILFQQTGLSSAFGDVDSGKTTRRGGEHFFFVSTIVIGIVFLGSSIFLAFVK